MSEQNQKAETIFDDPALALKAAKQDNMEGEPTLRPGIFENNPRLIVKTKVPNDRNHGKIEAAFSGRAFNSFLRAIEEIANTPGAGAIMMDNKGHRFIEKKRDPNPTIQSTIRIEKAENGVIALTISAGKQRPLIPFLFIDETYHQFRDASGNAMTMELASKLYALGWVDEIRTLMVNVRSDNYVKPAWMVRFEQQRQQGGGQGGGGGGSWGGGQQNGGNSWQQNNNGGGQRAPQQQQSNDFNFDADIPI